jgi:hypothetical protein
MNPRRRDAAQIRADRINEVWKYITQPDMLPNSLDFIIACLELKTGLTAQRLNEYIQIFARAHRIIIQGDTIDFYKDEE